MYFILCLRLQTDLYKQLFSSLCGRSSGVERYLAKVNVVSSNLIARSITLNKLLILSYNREKAWQPKFSSWLLPKSGQLYNQEELSAFSHILHLSYRYLALSHLH